MTLNRCCSGSQPFCSIVCAHEPDKVPHHTEVTASMPLWATFASQRDYFMGLGREIENFDFAGVPVHNASYFTFCSHELNCPTHIIGKGTHREGRCHLIGEFHCDDLVIYYIVITMVDTSSIWSFVHEI